MAHITFVKSFAGYNEGESATFYAERAEAMIKAGVAKPYEAPAVEATEAPKPSKKKKAESSEDSQAEIQF